MPLGGVGIVRGCGQLRKSDDGVERRIDLVRDVADEDAFHPVALFGGSLRAGEVAVHAEHYRDEDGGQQENARQADGAQLGAVQALFLRLLAQFCFFHVQPVDIKQRGEFSECLLVVVVDLFVVEFCVMLYVPVGGFEIAEGGVGGCTVFIEVVEIGFLVSFSFERPDQFVDCGDHLAVFVRMVVDGDLDFSEFDLREVAVLPGLDLVEKCFGFVGLACLGEQVRFLGLQTPDVVR